MEDLSDFLYFEKLSWAYHNHRKFSPEVALVTVTEPDTSEILDLGGSLPSDLFTDNFGTILGSFIAVPQTNAVGTTISIKDIGNSSRTINEISSTNGNSFSANSAHATGTLLQVGSSTTAAARADIAIGTAFSTSPESTQFNASNGSYSAGSGNITTSGSITAGNETATINETGLFQEMLVSAASSSNIHMIIHDIVTGVGFSNAKSITLQYSIND